MQQTTVHGFHQLEALLDSCDHVGSLTAYCIVLIKEPVQPRGMECGNTLTFLVALSIAADPAKCRSASPRERDRPNFANGAWSPVIS